MWEILICHGNNRLAHGTLVHAVRPTGKSLVLRAADVREYSKEGDVVMADVNVRAACINSYGDSPAHATQACACSHSATKGCERCAITTYKSKPVLGADGQQLHDEEGEPVREKLSSNAYSGYWGHAAFQRIDVQTGAFLDPATARFVTFEGDRVTADRDTMQLYTVLDSVYNARGRLADDVRKEEMDAYLAATPDVTAHPSEAAAQRAHWLGCMYVCTANAFILQDARRSIMKAFTSRRLVMRLGHGPGLPSMMRSPSHNVVNGAEQADRLATAQRAISKRHAVIGATGSSAYTELDGFRCAQLCLVI